MNPKSSGYSWLQWLYLTSVAQGGQAGLTFLFLLDSSLVLAPFSGRESPWMTSWPPVAVVLHPSNFISKWKLFLVFSTEVLELDFHGFNWPSTNHSSTPEPVIEAKWPVYGLVSMPMFRPHCPPPECMDWEWKKYCTFKGKERWCCRKLKQIVASIRRDWSREVAVGIYRKQSAWKSFQRKLGSNM